MHVIRRLVMHVIRRLIMHEIHRLVMHVIRRLVMHVIRRLVIACNMTVSTSRTLAAVSLGKMEHYPVLYSREFLIVLINRTSLVKLPLKLVSWHCK